MFALVYLTAIFASVFGFQALLTRVLVKKHYNMLPILSVLTLPGQFAHELSHAVAALATGGSAGKFQITPVVVRSNKVPVGIMFGNVMTSAGLFHPVILAAPIVLLVAAYFIVDYTLVNHGTMSMVQLVASVYLAANAVYGYLTMTGSDAPALWKMVKPLLVLVAGLGVAAGLVGGAIKVAMLLGLLG